MALTYNSLYEEPAYGVPEAAVYLRVPYQTLRYWSTGFGKRSPIIHPIQENPARLSFLNLLECHVLAGMRKVYDLKLPRVRNALRTVTEQDDGGPHPLINVAFLTDREDLFIERLGKVINVSQHGQMGLNYYHLHLERVKIDREGMFRFFPFVGEPRPSEPELVEINPMIGFGKPIIAGTGVSTAIIASRFNARESITDLAAEYGCSPQQIEEAIRWERPIPVAA
jgi:uncharacterized protein (DUF433 family)